MYRMIILKEKSYRKILFPSQQTSFFPVGSRYFFEQTRNNPLLKIKTLNGSHEVIKT